MIAVTHSGSRENTEISRNQSSILARMKDAPLVRLIQMQGTQLAEDEAANEAMQRASQE